MIAVIDYGGGNLQSLLAAIASQAQSFVVTDDPGRLRDADAAILPGDGAFGATMNALRARKLDREIEQFIRCGKPFLGICVGMQLLYDGSDEFGAARGLGIFAGTVSRFVGAPRLPHIGWNALTPTASHPFVRGLRSGDYVYFMHSYRAPVGPSTLATSTHGMPFCAIAADGNTVGTQFHPEKSQRTGAQLLKNFFSMTQTKEYHS